MGCSSSKDNVNPVKDNSQAWIEERNTNNINNNGKSTSTGITKSRPNYKLVQVKSKDGVRTLNTDCSASQHSLRSQSGTINRVVSSATSSKVSAHTLDSGLEEDYLPNMITEESEPEKKIIANERPPTPDLDIVGTLIPSRNNSSKEGRQQRSASSNDILEGLRSEGLLAAFSKRQGGIAFDLMIAPDFEILKKPPAKLAKLKRKKSKMKELTKEEIDAKIQAAEERRKRKEAKMIAKLNTSAKELHVHNVANINEKTIKNQTEENMTTTDILCFPQRKEAKMIAKLNTSAKELHVHNVANINEKTIKNQTEENMTTTDANATGNRATHLQALQDKLAEKQEHADEVRLARLERLAENRQTEEEEETAAA